jgi:hypothetical protein
MDDPFLDQPMEAVASGGSGDLPMHSGGHEQPLKGQMREGSAVVEDNRAAGGQPPSEQLWKTALQKQMELQRSLQEHLDVRCCCCHS